MKVRRKGKLTSFGKTVRKKLIDEGLSMSVFAEYIGIDARYLGDILYGRRSGAKYIVKIADRLGIDLKKDIV